MRVRGVRLRLAAVYAAASLVAVGALGLYAERTGAQRLRTQAADDLRASLGPVISRLDANALPRDQDDVWAYDTAKDTATALGNTDVEPPFQTIVKEAQDNGGTATDEFSLSGASFLVLAQAIPKSPLVLIAAADTSATTSAIHKLRIRIALAVAAAVAFTTAIAYLLSGLALRPARIAAERQRRFIADAAHELRTPIAVIQASASQTLQRTRDAEEYEHALGEIRAAAERAGAAVTELLDLARIESGAMALRRGPLRLDLLAEEVGVGATVTVDAPTPVVVDADYGLLRQAVDNLVRNSVAKAKTVEIHVRINGKDAVLEVSDDGPGFASDVLPRAFDRFERGADNQPGIGLGLALVRHIAELHGGTATAQNRPDGGAVVTLTLPVA